MRTVPLLLVLAACPKAPEPKCPEQPAVTAAPAEQPATPKAPELDDQAVISQSHAFFDAHDKADVAAFRALAGTAFIHFLHARTYDLQVYEKALQGRIDAKKPAWSRTCSKEKIVRAPGSATYIGECVVTIPASGDMPTTTSESFESLVWTPEGDAWKVAFWQWARAGAEAEREDWNDIFRSGSISFKTTPNQFLTQIVKGRRPGTALDIAMGQGRNAIFLAQQGWRVTGIDISDEAIKIARETAAVQKLKVDFIQQDANKFEFGTGKWDLVTLIYAGSDPKEIERIKPSIRRGGLFVVEFFAKESTQGTGIGGFQAGELAKQFAGWKILKDEVVEDIADWGLRKTKVVRFAAQKQ